MAQAFSSDDIRPLTGPLLVFAALVLALANFMAILDTTIANVSVPNIAGGLAISPSEGTWVITSYSVAEAITVPLTGWLAARFGAVRVFTLAVLSFGACSALCGLAPSFRSLRGSPPRTRRRGCSHAAAPPGVSPKEAPSRGPPRRT